MQSTVHKPLTRREMLSYAQILAGLLLLIAFAAVVMRSLIPHPEWIDLGTVTDLQSDVPITRMITRQDGTELVIWVVHTENKWLAFDGRVPFGAHCNYQWQTITARFEDLCSGARFARTGEYLDIYTYLRGTQVQNFDQYVVSIRDNRVYIDASRLNHAKPFTARAPTPECCVP